MSFRAQPSRSHLTIWGTVIVVIGIMAIILNWSLYLTLLVLPAPVGILISGQLGIYMQTYNLDEENFEIHNGLFSGTIRAPLDTLIGVQSIKINLSKQIFSGLPPLGVEVFFERYGNFILYTDDENLREILDNQLTDNNMVNFPLVASALRS